MQNQKKTVASVVRAMLNAPPKKRAYTFDEILAKVREEFPNAKTTKACVQWYMTKMRREGKSPRVKAA